MNLGAKCHVRIYLADLSEILVGTRLQRIKAWGDEFCRGTYQGIQEEIRILIPIKKSTTDPIGWLYQAYR